MLVLDLYCSLLKAENMILFKKGGGDHFKKGGGDNKELYSSFLPVIRNIERELKRKLFSHCRILLFRVTTKVIYFTNIKRNRRYRLNNTDSHLINFHFDITLNLQKICKSNHGNKFCIPFTQIHQLFAFSLFALFLHCKVVSFAITQYIRS